MAREDDDDDGVARSLPSSRRGEPAVAAAAAAVGRVEDRAAMALDATAYDLDIITAVVWCMRSSAEMVMCDAGPSASASGEKSFMCCDFSFISYYFSQKGTGRRYHPPKL